MAQKWLIEPPFGQTNNFILASMGDITGMAQKWLILLNGSEFELGEFEKGNFR